MEVQERDIFYENYSKATSLRSFTKEDIYGLSYSSRGEIDLGHEQHSTIRHSGMP